MCLESGVCGEVEVIDDCMDRVPAFVLSGPVTKLARRRPVAIPGGREWAASVTVRTLRL